MRDSTGRRSTKWTDADFDKPIQHWKPPQKLVYPCGETERSALEQLITDFAPLPPYDTSSVLQGLQPAAETHNGLVTVPVQLPDGYYAFLESTAEKCTSRETKHGMPTHAAASWRQRVDTIDGLIRRLTDGFSISLMYGERCGQYIRNSRNWRGNIGLMLDLDVFRDDKHPDAPPPVYSLDEMLSRYPLLARICAFILPSASSLYDGRPFKARGIILFPQPITDRRVFHAFGDLLLAEIDCLPDNVTKNAIAAGYGNTHNASQLYRNDAPDRDWIAAAIAKAKEAVLAENAERKAKHQRQQTRQQAYQRKAERNGNTAIDTGENISAFMERCDAVAEMERAGLMLHVSGNRYRWHESESDSACEVSSAGYLRIYSATMRAASPRCDGYDAVNPHRFYLWQLTGRTLDVTREIDKPACRDYLFSIGYGSDPAVFREQQRKPKLQKHTDTPDRGKTPPEPEPLQTIDENEQERLTALKQLLDISAFHTGTASEVFDTRLPEIQTAIAPLLDKERQARVNRAIAETHQAEKDSVIAFLTVRPAPPPILASGYITELNARLRNAQQTVRKSVYQELRGMKRDAKKKAFDCYRSAQDTTRAALKAELARVLGQTRIVTVADATGTGKSHDSRVILLKYENRTIALAPNIKLGQQLESDAGKLGFNPRHLRGRDVNWDASGLAIIPQRMRDETMFDKNPCIMFDETEKYTHNNIAAMVYCQSKCPFREACIQNGHLAQFRDLEAIDFVITCAPNLLFNPQFLGFLKRLNTTETHDPACDELYGIDLSTPTPAPQDTSTERKQRDSTLIFDTAIIDDYEVDKLYNTCTISKERILALRDAWKTEKHTHAVSRFADNIAQVFLETDNVNAFEKLSAAVDALEANEIETVNTELAHHARLGKCERIPTPKNDDAGNTIAEYCVRFDNDSFVYIPTAENAEHAEQTLKARELPFVERKHIPPETRVGDPIIVPQTVYAAILNGTAVEKITPVWQPHWTLLKQLQALIGSVATSENAPVRIADGYIEFDVPPQNCGLLKTIIMLSPQDNTAELARAFDGQNVTIEAYTADPTEWETGVQVYQYQGNRVTTASVFEYPMTDTGERMLQSAPISLRPKYQAILDKLNDIAKATDGFTAFISYKEFTTQFTDAVNGFDSVRHFDNIAGLNLKGLKLLIIFGYPKVSHSVLMNAAIRQYANDPKTIPRGDPNLRDENGKTISEYMQLTENAEFTENGITITERRYKDSRLDAIRLQLSIDKLNQAIGRARQVRWENTTTLIYTNALIPNVTARAALFTDAAFNLAKSPSELPAAMERIKQAEQIGDIKGIMETQGVSQRTAYRKRNAVQKSDNSIDDRNGEIVRLHESDAKPSNRKIAEIMTNNGYEKVSEGTVRRVVNRHKRVAASQLTTPISTLIGNGKSDAAPENASAPCLDAASPKNCDAVCDAVCDATNSGSDAACDAAPIPREKLIIELHQAEHSNRQIATIMQQEGYEHVSEGTVRRFVNKHKETHPQNTAIPPSVYNTLTETDARAELDRLTAAHNYNYAAMLRQVFRDNKWKLSPAVSEPLGKDSENGHQTA